MKQVNSQGTGFGHQHNIIIHINLHSHTNPLTDFCDQFCLTDTIEEPTRVTNMNKSLIDVIL